MCLDEMEENEKEKAKIVDLFARTRAPDIESLTKD